jgi:hypothetical protein
MNAKIVILFLLIIQACTPDRSFELPGPVAPVGGSDNILPGTLRINEFMASGSTFVNELDASGTDWLEIYNTTTDTIWLEEDKWFLTDSLADPLAFELPDTMILPNNFLIVWCDGFDTTITQIHANFGLSKDGEDIGLTYLLNDSSSVTVDSHTFSAQTNGVAMARFPDGSANWVFTTNPTPQQPNQE